MPPRLNLQIPVSSGAVECSYRIDDDTQVFTHPTFNLIINKYGVTYNKPHHVKSAHTASTSASTVPPLQSIVDFQLKSIIGKGGSSIVYYAEHSQKPDLCVAIKQLNVHDQSARHQLYKELLTLY